ncbi:MAG: hypothetical protein J1G30_04780 [Spirochaetales bacterium]|nr:hypothetical protein [Spirochaetales bacterium]
MKRFQFKLEKVLRIRERAEQNAKLAYAQVLQKKNALELDNKNCERIIEDTNTERQEYVNENHMFDFNIFSAFDANVRALLRRQELNNREITKLQPLLDERESALREAMKQRKILEKLKEKAYANFLLEAENEETDMIDEAALNMVTHSNYSKSVTGETDD